MGVKTNFVGWKSNDDNLKELVFAILCIPSTSLFCPFVQANNEFIMSYNFPILCDMMLSQLSFLNLHLPVSYTSREVEGCQAKVDSFQHSLMFQILCLLIYVILFGTTTETVV